jgi:hypothetical protein
MNESLETTALLDGTPENEFESLEPAQDDSVLPSNEAVPSRLRGRLRGRPRGPRGRGRGGVARSVECDGPTTGWSTKSIKETLREEKSFISEMLSERARLLCSVGVDVLKRS